MYHEILTFFLREYYHLRSSQTQAMCRCVKNIQLLAGIPKEEKFTVVYLIKSPRCMSAEPAISVLVLSRVSS